MNTTKPPRERYDVPEIAEKWGVSVPDVIDWGETGKLPFYTFASNWPGHIVDDSDNGTESTVIEPIPIRGMVKLDPIDITDAASNGHVDVWKGQLEDGRWVQFQEKHRVLFGALRVIRQEAENFAAKYKLGGYSDEYLVKKDSQRPEPKELGKREAENLLETIAVLAYLVAESNGPEFYVGERLNASKISEECAQFLTNNDLSDEHGLSKRSIEGRISKGVKLLTWI